MIRAVLFLFLSLIVCFSSGQVDARAQVDIEQASVSSENSDSSSTFDQNIQPQTSNQRTINSGNSSQSQSTTTLDLSKLDQEGLKRQTQDIEAKIKLNQEQIVILQKNLDQVVVQNLSLTGELQTLQFQNSQEEQSLNRIKLLQDSLVVGQKAQSDLESQIEDLVIQTTELQANQSNAQLILDRTQSQSDQQSTNFRREVIDSSWKYVIFGALILIYFLIQRFLISLVNRNILENRSRSFIVLIIRIGFGIAIILTSISFFASELNGVLAFAGILSAALAFALQDFVASFFGWVFIRTKGKFKEKDLIQVTTSEGYLVGAVVKIEIFRTILDQREGGGSGFLDREKPTGRQISIPNSLIVRGAVFSSPHSLVLWHSANFLVTMDSNWEKAELIIQKILDKQFDQHFLEQHKLKADSRPRLTLDIASSGVNFNIWFPSPIGGFRINLDQLSRSVLKEFNKSKIKLAYNTIQINQN